MVSRFAEVKYIEATYCKCNKVAIGKFTLREAIREDFSCDGERAAGPEEGSGSKVRCIVLPVSIVC